MPNIFEYTTRDQRQLPPQTIPNIQSYLASNNIQRLSDIHQSERTTVARHLAGIIRDADPSHVLIEPLEQWSGYEENYGTVDLLHKMISSHQPNRRSASNETFDNDRQAAKEALLATIVGPQGVLQPGDDASIAKLCGALVRFNLFLVSFILSVCSSLCVLK